MTRRKTKPASAVAPARRAVLLLDDHPVIREALALRIEREPDLSVCAALDDPRAILPAIEKHRPDLAIIDLSLRVSHGLEVIKSIRAVHPRLRLLVFSMHDEMIYAERTLHAGAQGYVMKHESPEQLLEAIRLVLEGEIAVSPRIASRVLKAGAARRAPDRHGIERLSDRELEIFQLMGRGLDTKEIATRLGIGIKTVETFRTRIKGKLGIASMSELIAQAAHWIASRES